ncbi:Uncharacterised protein [Clostridium fallax]|uniref:Uncharacterized protein n=1 Tax=Clostridium fallax TaxID=1533 RepID=A0A1M4Y031_9CLOT|nr:hypothetical protein SAMN05443638_12233 [Clostridium fallax]SQB06500.1 Uncharacterised protein [Clostridium fallax]
MISEEDENLKSPLFNLNMRCIEITINYGTRSLNNVFNLNMRCIEIAKKCFNEIQNMSLTLT